MCANHTLGHSPTHGSTQVDHLRTIPLNFHVQRVTFEKLVIPIAVQSENARPRHRYSHVERNAGYTSDRHGAQQTRRKRCSKHPIAFPGLGNGHQFNQQARVIFCCHRLEQATEAIEVEGNRMAARRLFDSGKFFDTREVSVGDFFESHEMTPEDLLRLQKELRERRRQDSEPLSQAQAPAPAGA